VHARLRLDDDRLIIEDAGSRNGLAVNFKPIAGAVSLKPGDVICLGMHEFRYVELEQPTHTH
jgi:pSer/pThr/pTyr-binding forkhead associated (FHA) protein